MNYAGLLAEAEQLLAKGDEGRSPEEDRLLATLVILIQAYEESEQIVPEASPRDVLLHLMEEHELRQADLLFVFGSRSIVSAVVNGKRDISKTQAKKLAELFHVGADLFL